MPHRSAPLHRVAPLEETDWPVSARLTIKRKAMSFFAVMALFYVLAMGPITCARVVRPGAFLTLLATAVSIVLLIAVGVGYRLLFGFAEMETSIPVCISGFLILLCIFVGVRLIHRDV